MGVRDGPIPGGREKMHCKACGEEVRYDPETDAYFHRVTGYPELETLAREVTE